MCSQSKELISQHNRFKRCPNSIDTLPLQVCIPWVVFYCCWYCWLLFFMDTFVLSEWSGGGSWHIFTRIIVFRNIVIADFSLFYDRYVPIGFYTSSTCTNNNNDKNNAFSFFCVNGSTGSHPPTHTCLGCQPRTPIIPPPTTHPLWCQMRTCICYYLYHFVKPMVQIIRM